MTEQNERAALRRRANAIRWRVRNLRLAADELEAIADELDPPAPAAGAGDGAPGTST